MTGAILVLEGADASGKTTLAWRLVERHGARYLHLGPYRDVWRWHLGSYLRAARLAAAGELVVVDRHWWSECAYGAVYRGGSAYPVAARCLDRLWLRTGAVHVLCAPTDLEAQVARRAMTVKERGNAYSTDAARDVRAVVAYYADLRRGNVAHPGGSYLDQWVRWGDVTARDDTLVYDLDRDDLDRFADRAVRRARARRRSQLPAGRDPARPNYAGHPARARWLMVGEAPSPSVPRPDLAFPFVDRCSRLSAATWLNRALHELGVREDHLLWVNARTEARWSLTATELQDVTSDERTRVLPVVALGRVARDAARHCDFSDVRPARHPQSARRFDHRGDYAAELREVLT